MTATNNSPYEMYADSSLELSCLITGLLKQAVLPEVIELGEECFYDNKHHLIFQAMKELYNAGEEVDITAIRTHLAGSGQLEKAGGESYLADMLRGYTTVNHRYILNALRKLSGRRKLQMLSLRMKEMNSGSQDIEEIIAEINNTVKHIDSLNKADIIEARDLFNCDVESFNVTGKSILSGYTSMDKLLLGFFGGDLIVIAARPGCGKTAFALNIASNVSKTHEVLFFSLEMPPRQLGLRMISSETMIDSHVIRRGGVTPEQKSFIDRTAQSLRKRKLAVSNERTLDAITGRIRKVVSQKQLGLVVIDYLQLVKVSLQAQRYIQIGEITRTLKTLAIELDIPIIILAQLNREADNSAPRLSHLRESGDIEADADVVILLYHEEATPDDNINVIYAKHRGGEANRAVAMLFKKPITRFFDVKVNTFEEAIPL